MGVSGTLEFLSDLVGSGGQKHKKRQLQTVELKVRMDCDGCELKVKNALSSMTGMSLPFHLSQFLLIRCVHNLFAAEKKLHFRLY